MKNIKSKLKTKTSMIALMTLLFSLIVTTIILDTNRKDKKSNVQSYNEFLANLENGKITDATITSGAKISFKISGSDETFITDNPRSENFKQLLLEKNVNVTEGQYITAISIVQGGLSFVFMGFVVYMIYSATKKQGSKAKSNFKAEVKEDLKFTFDLIAGNDEAKDGTRDIIDFIKTPEKFTKYGAKMPKGIVFYGPPGTGKTLMAKAIAGEAGVDFYNVSGSDFVQMYVGVGALRIRELFKKARESEKAVIFIDEIDALGKKRSSSANSGNDEREQTLNALLTEMSGFSDSDGIIVIGATNRLDTLDDALLRPGRFDRQVEIALPDKKAREEILNLYLKDKLISPQINNSAIKDLATQTIFFSGASLANLINESAIFAAKRDANYIEKQDIEKAYYTIIAGSEKVNKSDRNNIERKITAFHEAGHALASKMLQPENTIAKITIIPSTKGAGGFCVNIPPDKMYYTKEEIKSQIIVLLSGRAAEELIFGKENITTGASNDIEKATYLAKDFISKFGMSDNFGLINLSAFSNESDIISECKTLLDELFNQSKELIINNKQLLETLAECLLENESLGETQINELFAA